MPPEIIRCPPERFAELFGVAEVAFSEGLPAEAIDRLGQFVDRDRWFTALDRDRLVSSSGLFEMRFTVPGGELPTGGVTWVTVLPTHRRQGILTGMMRRMLVDCRERGEPLAALFASESSIYQRFGFGLASWALHLEAETRSTRFAREWPREGEVRLLRPEEALPLAQRVYDQARLDRPGFFARSPEWWWWSVLPDPEKDRRGGEAKRVVVYETDAGPEAYAVYRTKPEWSPRGTAGLLTVSEAIGCTDRGSREIWRWLLDVDLIRTLRASLLPVDHPLLNLVAEPRRLGASVGDGLWLRIVDLAAALEGRRYGADVSLTLELADAFCAWNAGRWRIEIEAGRARVKRSSDAADLALDANDLASLFLGGVSPSALAAAGRIVELRPGALTAADRAFVSAVAPWTPQEF